MRIAWASDIHLTDAYEQVKQNFATSLAKAKPDCVLLSGDISTARFLYDHLKMLESAVKVPIYFVCGNHDFWGSSLHLVNIELTQLSTYNKNIQWMGCKSYVKLKEGVALVGHDCFYDAGYGDWKRSRFALNDWNYTKDFMVRPIQRVVEVARNYAMKGARHIERNLSLSLDNDFKKVFVLMHPPPFAEASMHMGMPGSPDAIPWYSCKVAGDVLLQTAKRYGDREIDVLCGHTHSKCTYAPLDNLTVRVQDAEYHKPTFSIIDLK
jgi:predicted phosphohydrolase